jgi:hypothetical protein
MARFWPGERELPLRCRTSSLPKIVTLASYRVTSSGMNNSVRLQTAGQL